MIKEKFDLTGRIALVTGSTRGIGKAIGDALEEYGAKVIRHNSKVCDLSDPAAIDAFFAKLEAENSMPDILVANASIQQKTPWTEFPMDEAHKEIQVNFLATLRMFQLCYPKMKAQKWGRLIAVGSVNERRPHPDMCVYAATKSAQENLIRGIGRQVASEGITVNNLCPGVFYKKYCCIMLGDVDAQPIVKTTGYGVSARETADYAPKYARVHADWRHDALEAALRTNRALIEEDLDAKAAPSAPSMPAFKPLPFELPPEDVKPRPTPPPPRPVQPSLPPTVHTDLDDDDPETMAALEGY